MTVTKVAISLPNELLARVDALAAETGRSRSAVIRSSLQQSLAALEDERAVREARAIYAELEQDPGLQELHDTFAAASYATVAPYDPQTKSKRPRRRATAR